MKKTLILCLLVWIIIIAGCNDWNNKQISFENTSKCQEYKEKFLSDMIDYFSIEWLNEYFAPVLSPYKDKVDIFYSPITNSCIWAVFWDRVEWDDQSHITFSQELYVIKDLFTSNICRTRSNLYYSVPGPWFDGLDISRKCDWLKSYDDKNSELFMFRWDEINDNLDYSKDFYDKEIKYLKWN